MIFGFIPSVAKEKHCNRTNGTYKYIPHFCVIICTDGRVPTGITVKATAQ
jgi:hypothetical protein